MTQPQSKKAGGKWILILVIVVVLIILSIIIAGVIAALFTGEVSVGMGNTAVIPVKGVVVSESSNAFFAPQNAVGNTIVKQINKADADPRIKAILLEINSPGGQPVASDEIATAVEESDKVTVAWIRDVGASGAYWVASAADHIVAHRMSMTGSIGATASYLEFSGLLDDYNVTYEQLEAGEYKEVGVPYKNLTSEERSLLMKQLGIIHQFFIEEVSQNRGLTQEQIDNISTGMFYLGVQAKQLNLVDKLGSKKEALNYIEDKINQTPQLVRFEEKKGFFEMLTRTISQQSFLVGKGIKRGLLSRELEIST